MYMATEMTQKYCRGKKESTLTKPGGYCIYDPQGETVKFCTDLEVSTQGFALIRTLI